MKKESKLFWNYYIEVNRIVVSVQGDGNDADCCSALALENCYYTFLRMFTTKENCRYLILQFEFGNCEIEC